MCGDLPFDVALGSVGALIPKFLSASDAELHFGDAAREIEPQRYDRESFFADAALQPRNLCLLYTSHASGAAPVRNRGEA